MAQGAPMSAGVSHTAIRTTERRGLRLYVVAGVRALGANSGYHGGPWFTAMEATPSAAVHQPCNMSPAFLLWALPAPGR